jgi:probable rRNA maturation factor
MPVDVQFAADHDLFKSVGCSVSELIAQWAEAVMAHGGSKETAEMQPSVCIRIVEKEESQGLNSTYRGKNKATNVLSFPAEIDEALVGKLDLKPLGDIVICAEVVADEARQQKKSLKDHLAHIVVHGMLHLYGYDHERSVAAADEMEANEREILDRFGVSDPYQEI